MIWGFARKEGDTESDENLGQEFGRALGIDELTTGKVNDIFTHTHKKKRIQTFPQKKGKKKEKRE